MTARSKPRKIAGASLAIALGLGSIALGGIATSASAVEVTPWTPQSTATLYPVYENEEQCYDGGIPVLVSASVNEVAGERVGNFTVNGNPLPGDAEYRVGVGEYTYTYTVTNLNSTADPQESVSLGGSFSVVACEVPEPPASPTVGTPTASGSLVNGTPTATVTVPVTVPEGASGELGVWFGEEQPLSPNVTITESGDITFAGEVPCGTTDFTVVLDGLPVGSASVTIDCAVPNPEPNPGDGGVVNPLPDSGTPDDTTPNTDDNANNDGTTPNTDDTDISDSITRPGAGTGDVAAASVSSALPINASVFYGAGAALLFAAALMLMPTVRARANR